MRITGAPLVRFTLSHQLLDQPPQSFPLFSLALLGVITLNAAAFRWLSLWLPIPLFSRWLLVEPNASSSHRLTAPR